MTMLYEGGNVYRNTKINHLFSFYCIMIKMFICKFCDLCGFSLTSPATFNLVFCNEYVRASAFLLCGSSQIIDRAHRLYT